LFRFILKKDKRTYYLELIQTKEPNYDGKWPAKTSHLRHFDGLRASDYIIVVPRDMTGSAGFG